MSALGYSLFCENGHINRYKEDIDETEKLLNSEYRSLADLVDQIREKCSPEERELLNSIWDAADRLVFLVAWLRSHLDLKNHDHIIETLHEMFEGGEDDFESYYPKLANFYLRQLAVERFYANKKVELASSVGPAQSGGVTR